MNTKAAIFAVTALAAMLPPYAAAADFPPNFSQEAKAKLAGGIQLVPSEHQINIVYFYGCDFQPVKDYERRIGELFAYVQQFYGQAMQRYGFGARSFGLPILPNGNVDIITIKGKLPHKDYPYSDGYLKVFAELDEFFAAHPEKRRSGHTFIVMPTWLDGEFSNENPGGVPYYGEGRSAFAMDYEGFDLRYLGDDTPKGRLLTKYLGGLAHELGHALNLPHNNGTPDQNKAMGTPLMNAGNYTLGMKPTYLTKASCKILDTSETFAPKGCKTVFYTSQQDVKVTDQELTLENGDTLVFKFHTNAKFKCVNAYIQDAPFAVDEDYERVVFTEVVRDAADPTLYTVRMPLKDIASLEGVQRHAGVGGIDLLFVEEEGSLNGYRVQFDWNAITPQGTPLRDVIHFKGY